jgi:hypothetical protein
MAQVVNVYLSAFGPEFKPHYCPPHPKTLDSNAGGAGGRPAEVKISEERTGAPCEGWQG